MGGDEERRPLFEGGSLRSHGSISIPTTPTTNTLSDIVTGQSGGGGVPGGSSVSLGSNSSSVGGSGTRFTKPAKSVSFAGDDHSDSTGPTFVDRINNSNTNSGRPALEERSPDRSPPRGGRLALRQGMGYGSVGMGAGAGARANGGQSGEAVGAAEASVPPGAALSEEGDSWALGNVEGGTSSENVDFLVPSEGQIMEEVDNENTEEDMSSFIVLDCSKVTNVSGSL